MYPDLNEWLKQTTPGWNWDWSYQLYLQSFLNQVTLGELRYLIVQIPIRHGKSELCTVRYPVYRMQYGKNLNVVTTANTGELAETFGRKARRIVQSRMIPFNEEKTAVSDWELLNGNSYRSVGVGGAIIGRGFELLIVDDPIKSREEAESLTIRDKVYEWFTQDLYGRQEPGAAIIVIMSRWHEDDLVGRLRNDDPDKWTVVDLPALAIEGEDDPLGRQPGEALCPERYDEKALADRRKTGGEYQFLSQYQGRPTAKEGSFFKIEKFRFIDALPMNLRKVRAWDMAATEDDGNWTVGVLMGADSAGWYVIDVVRGQWDTGKRDEIIKLTAQLDGIDVKVHGPQDPAAAGKTAAAAFIKLLAGFAVKTERVSGSKEIRADPYSSQVNAGNVSILRASWNKEYIEELRQFPLGKDDDQVDASADAFNALSNQPLPAHVPPSDSRIELPREPVALSSSGGRIINGLLYVPDTAQYQYHDPLYR